MPRDKTKTHARVLAAAKNEFAEYGFENASMRRIGQQCGITAAGLYRHCTDKADLFDQIAGIYADKLNQYLNERFLSGRKSLEGDYDLLWQKTVAGMMRELVYPDLENYRLLFTRSQGTKYENLLHEITEKIQEDILTMLPLHREQGFRIREIRPHELHLILSAYLTALFEPVIHDYTTEDALLCLDSVEAFFLPGWKQLFGFSELSEKVSEDR